MGYERKLYIVSESSAEGWNYAEILAMIDLSKTDYDLDKLFTEDATNYIYINDDEVTEDMYGDTIKSALPQDVIESFEEHWERTHYWRYKSALDLIKSIMDYCDTRDKDSIRVYSYGY